MCLRCLLPTLTSNGFCHTKNKKCYYIQSVNGHLYFTMRVLRAITRQLYYLIYNLSQIVIKLQAKNISLIIDYIEDYKIHQKHKEYKVYCI